MRLSKNTSGLRLTLSRQEYEHLALSEPQAFLRLYPDSVTTFIEISGRAFSGSQAVSMHKHSSKAEEDFRGLMVVKWMKDTGYTTLPDFTPIEMSTTLAEDQRVLCAMPPAKRMSRMSGKSERQKALAVVEATDPQPEREARQAIAGTATFHNLQGAVDLVNQLREELGPGVKISIGKGGRLLVNVQFGG